MTETKLIWCCDCQKKVDARLTTGKEIYPHRDDLIPTRYFIHDECGNYVGTHSRPDKQGNVRPLGCIPNAEIRKGRAEIHKILDPMWQNRKYKRNAIYRLLTDHLGFEYHTGQLRNMEEINKVIEFLKKIDRPVFEKPYAPDWVTLDSGHDYSEVLRLYWKNNKRFDEHDAQMQGFSCKSSSK